MALTVFLRGANVGGRNVFRPAEVAAKLARLRVTSIGAAGTFVVDAAATAAEARRAFERALGFETHILVRPASEILSLVAADPFRDHAIGSDVKAYVTVLERRPSPAPRTPLRMPDGAAWQVSVIAVRGVFALSLHRRAGRTLVYPNEAIEKRLGLAATTRNWNTIERLARAIGDGA